MGALEKRTFQRECVFFFDSAVSGTLAGGQTITNKMALAATPALPIHGQRRLRGYCSTDKAPAAGFPRLRFGEDGTNIDMVFALVQDAAQPNFEFPFDVPAYADYFVPELTNGAAAGATVRFEVWADPEGSGPAVLGGSTPPAPPASSPYVLTPQGYQQLSQAQTQAVVQLTVPAAAKFAYLTTSVNDIRFTDDGSAPAAATGFPIHVGQIPFFYTGGQAGLVAIKLISTDPAGSLVDVLYYS